MEAILIKVMAFVLIIALSYVLKRVGFFKTADFKLISNIVLKLTLPCAVISNFNRINVESSLFELVLVGVLCNLLTIGIGYLAAFNKGRNERAFNMINYSGYNIGCFTMPYIQSFLGPSGVVATCLFDAGNSLRCTGATYSMAASVARIGDRPTVALFFRRMFASIAMDVYILMVILVWLHIKLPPAVTAFTDTVGEANPFLAMVMIGVGFELHPSRKNILHVGSVLLHRYLVAAILAWLFYHYAPFSPEVRKILTLIAFAPVSAVCAIFTAKCKGDVALSCTINSLTIVLSVIFMTTLMICL
ncbi:MAG: AEC family transporter [Paraprevotella sp.]|nr:AEC family transporter [Paraprevotella sp.]